MGPDASPVFLEESSHPFLSPVASRVQRIQVIAQGPPVQSNWPFCSVLRKTCVAIIAICARDYGIAFNFAAIALDLDLTCNMLMPFVSNKFGMFKDGCSVRDST